MTHEELAQWCLDHNDVEVTISAYPIDFGNYTITMTSLNSMFRIRRMINQRLDVDWEIVLDEMYKKLGVRDVDGRE